MGGEQKSVPPGGCASARAVKALVAGYAAEWAERAADLAALRARGCRIIAHRYERSDKVAALFDRLAETLAEASLVRGRAGGGWGLASMTAELTRMRCLPHHCPRACRTRASRACRRSRPRARTTRICACEA